MHINNQIHKYMVPCYFRGERGILLDRILPDVQEQFEDTKGVIRNRKTVNLRYQRGNQKP